MDIITRILYGSGENLRSVLARVCSLSESHYQSYQGLASNIKNNGNVIH